jgi:Concanavalin A-like lectin/glucanases superfamily
MTSRQKVFLCWLSSGRRVRAVGNICARNPKLMLGQIDTDPHMRCARVFLFLALLLQGYGPHASGQVVGGFEPPIASTAAQSSLRIGLIAFWNMNETTAGTRVDCVGGHNLADNANNVNGDPAGIINYCASAGASAGCGLTTTNAAFNLTNAANFTMTTWFKGPLAGSAGYPLISKGTSDTANEFCFYCDVIDQSYHYTWNGAAGRKDYKVIDVNVFSFSAWHFLAFGYDVTNAAMWIQLDGSARVLFPEAAIQFSTNYLNFANHGPSGSSPWTGRIDATGFWNRLLTPMEVAQVYNAGSSQECPLIDEGQTYPFSTVAQVADWQGRVYLASASSPTGPTITHLETAWNGAVSDGFTSKLVTWGLFTSNSLAAARTPLYWNPAYESYFLWNNSGFASGDLSINGLTGNGSSKYLDSTILGSNLPQYTTGVGWYMYSAVDLVVDFGMVDSGTAHLLGRESYFRNGDPAVNNINPAAGGNAFYVNNRTSSTDHRAYLATSSSAFAQYGSTDSASDTLAFPSFNFLIFCYNSFGTPRAHTSGTMSAMAVGVGMTSSDWQNLYNRTQTFRVSEGGGFR